MTLVAASPTPEAAIGFCSGETADAKSATVSVLAYQHDNQSCGYSPSSARSGLDKRNVRDGHGGNADVNLVISADEHALHGQVVHVIDLAKIEGISKFAINVERSR